ncbi:DUF5642 family protein [Mycobacterium sp. 141]|uniref:DUF5642 family protein n=1 Tax=Mycobacterium sp. 141 TaxID=1120797 RepID=UPI000382D7C0|nr:DUF5642 family protein [Mycobacterium sp. 141]
MPNRNVLPVIAGTVVSACALVACSHSDKQAYPNANIANVTQVKTDFGPEFKVKDIAPTGIDPKILAPQKIPPGMAFEPADCSKFAEGQTFPPGLKGNMAASVAEGAGQRFIVLAVETSEPIPVNHPGEECKQVKFVGPGSRGQVDVVEAPEIDGIPTLGTHRVVQTWVQGHSRTGELYNYVASFGPYLVIVTANPLVQPDKPVTPVDTGKARDLLTSAVAAVKG